MIPQWTDQILEGKNSISSPSVLSFVNENILFFDESLVMLMDCDYYYSLYRRYGAPCILENYLVANTSYPHQISKTYDKDLQTEIDLIKNKKFLLPNKILHEFKSEFVPVLYRRTNLISSTMNFMYMTKKSAEDLLKYYKVSLKDEFRSDFLAFKKELIEITSNLPHIGTALPKVWVDIRIELEKLKMQVLS